MLIYLNQALAQIEARRRTEGGSLSRRRRLHLEVLRWRK
jgi:hypothetical protein